MAAKKNRGLIINTHGIKGPNNSFIVKEISVVHCHNPYQYEWLVKSPYNMKTSDARSRLYDILERKHRALHIRKVCDIIRILAVSVKTIYVGNSETLNFLKRIITKRSMKIEYCKDMTTPQYIRNNPLFGEYHCRYHGDVKNLDGSTCTVRDVVYMKIHVLKKIYSYDNATIFKMIKDSEYRNISALRKKKILPSHIGELCTKFEAMSL